MLKDLSDIEVLAFTIIGEARGEPIEGKVAVGSVIRNRVFGKSKDYASICLAKKQFSCWNSDDPNSVFLDNLITELSQHKSFWNGANYKECMFIAGGIYDNILSDNTKGAKHYMTTSLFNSDKRPKWAKYPLKTPVVKGNQTFIVIE